MSSNHEFERESAIGSRVSLSCIVPAKGKAYMRAECVEASWDSAKGKWAIRIQSGEEVIRRFCDMPKSADEQTLRAAARQTAIDEGYDVELAQIAILR